MKILRRVSSTLILLGLLFSEGAYSFESPKEPNEIALEIALRSKNPQKVLKELSQRVKNMKPSSDGLITQKLLADTQSLLGTAGYPKFEFQLAKKSTSQEVVDRLLKELPEEIKGEKSYVPAEWTTPEAKAIFPKWKPMSILAAPGSYWKGHHSYPGGLVYHLYTTAITNVRLLETYENALHFRFKQSEKDLVVLSGIWHDSAKIWTLTWKEDGTLTSQEGKIAWAGSHHVISAAEALVRGHSKEFVSALAASHDAAFEGGESHKKVLDYLAATAVLANRSLEEVGLKKEKGQYQMLQKPTLAMMIQNLGDGDWVLVEQAIKTVRPHLEEIYKTTNSISKKNWQVSEALSRRGEVALYSDLIQLQSR